jgi:3-phenylpropionate/trans-cinnamate dioxygenase subunit alpha
VSYKDLMDLEDQGWMSPEVFHSTDLYQRELRTVFARSWLFLAHESQLRKPGDFVQAIMGEDPVLVTRRSDGKLRAMLNVCRHRGMRVCRQDLGNSARFTCSYHGWSYDSSGALVDFPEENDAYHGIVDKAGWSLIPVTQLATYRGFIFGTWDPEAPSLDDYLAGAKPALDSLLDLNGGDIELVGPMKWRLTGNWKLAAEQFASDSYHGQTAHVSAVNTLSNGKHFPTEFGYQYSTPGGHGAAMRNHQRGLQPSVFAVESSPLETEISVGHATVFPNLSFLRHGALRVWQPRGPEGMEIWAWAAIPAGADENTRKRILKQEELTFSATGIFEIDDSENW